MFILDGMQSKLNYCMRNGVFAVYEISNFDKSRTSQIHTILDYRPNRINEEESTNPPPSRDHKGPQDCPSDDRDI